MMKRITLAIAILWLGAGAVQGQQLWHEMPLPGTTTLRDAHFCVSPRGPVFIHDVHDLYRTLDRGATWQKIGPPISDKVICDSSGTLFLVTSGAILISTDDGTTWPEAMLNVPWNYQDLEASRFGLEAWGLRSTDSGHTWNERKENGSEKSAVFWGAGDERLYWQDIGTYWWVNDTGGHIIPKFNTGEFAGDNVNPENFLIASNHHYFLSLWGDIFRSTDDGATWDGVTRPDSIWLHATPSSFVEVPGVGFIGLRQARQNADSLYATELSTDDGITWSHLGDAPVHHDVSLMARDRSGMLYARMDNKVYRMAGYAGLPTSATSDFAVLPCFPNPTQSATTIRYRLQNAADVNVTVQDLLGRDVLRSTYLHQSSGDHTTSLDLTGFVEGSYRVTVIAGTQRAVQNIVRIR